MLYYLLEDYLSPFKCMFTVFEQTIFENYWICCAYWRAQLWLLNATEQQCGAEVVSNMNEMIEYITPDLPDLQDRCSRASPGGLLTCAMWHYLNMSILTVVALVTLWAVLVTLLWCRLLRQSRQSTPNMICQHRTLHRLLPDCVRVELQPLKRKEGNITSDENGNHA